MQKFTRAREDLHTPEETLRLADWKTLGQLSNKATVGPAIAKFSKTGKLEVDQIWIYFSCSRQSLEMTIAKTDGTTGVTTPQ